MMKFLQRKSILPGAETPQFDVILRFDREAEDYFSALIEKLAFATGNRERLESGQPPHVSLGIFTIPDAADPVRVMEPVLRAAEPFSVVFDALGAFVPGTLIAMPVVTDALISLNLAVHHAAEGIFVPVRKYVFGSWVPHLTLGLELTQAELAEAFRTAAETWRPFSARTASLSVVHHFPYTEELVVPLACESL